MVISAFCRLIRTADVDRTSPAVKRSDSNAYMQEDGQTDAHGDTLFLSSVTSFITRNPHSAILLTTLLKRKFHLDRHVTYRHNTTRSTCRAHAFWLCRHARLEALDTSNVSCRVETWRDVTSQVEFGLNWKAPREHKLCKGCAVCLRMMR